MNRFSPNTKKFYGFTVIELVLVMVIIGIIVPIMLNIYRFIITSNKEIGARYETIQQGYEFFEKLNILMQDYTVDYEEYYNRQMVGCTEGGGTGDNFKWQTSSGYCSNFTAYGNYNSTEMCIDAACSPISGNYHNIYYCTTVEGGVQSNRAKLRNGGAPAVYKDDICGRRGSFQSFGQYAALFVDVKDEVGSGKNSVGDSDDRNLGETVKPGVNAIADADDIQELYFISHDGKNRLYFRRKLVKTKDKYSQYKIQMLRLRGFDAGQKHSFKSEDLTNNQGLYDGNIDTWACDAGMGFKPKDTAGRHNLGGAYTEYYLPLDEDDCWMDLTRGSTTVSSRKITISPTTDSELAWAKDNRQINAYMKILIVNGLYPPYFGALTDSAGDYKVPLQTTINMKDFYRN